MKKKIQNGFTIVELLIVIVVIGILAAIIITTYKGIQHRAYNTQVIAGVSQYLKLIESYQSLEGNFPQTTKEKDGHSIALACLGTGYPDSYCGKVTNTDTYEDPALEADLQKVGKGSAIASSELHPGPESFIGAVYGIDITDSSKSPTGYARTIQYALYGDDQDCKIPSAWSYRVVNNPPITACEIVLESVPAR